MLKSIQFKLSKIKYSGDSIGDDIRAEISVLGKFLSIDKRIKAGTTVEINQDVGRFETDQGLFNAVVLITVIEKDLLFNDVGSVKGSVKVNTVNTKPQQFVFEVKVRESRSILAKSRGKSTAVFEITFEAEVLDAIRYVSFEQGRGGWTNVELKNKNTEIALPAYLKVRLEEQDAKRQHFTILEGSWQHKNAAVKIEPDGALYLESTNHQTDSVYLIYSISGNILKFNGKKFKIKNHPADVEPPQKGLYDLEIPDCPHGAGQRYLDSAELAKVWFPVGHDKSGRYLHTGSVTRGCITLTEIERWDELCKYLMKARKGDGVSIGVLEVVE